MDSFQLSDIGLTGWLMLAAGVIFGYIIKWLVSAPSGRKGKDIGEPGLAIQLEQTRMDARARASSDAARIESLQLELEQAKAAISSPVGSDVEELRARLETQHADSESRLAAVNAELERTAQRFEEASQRADMLAHRVEELESAAAESAGYAARIAEQNVTIESLHAALDERSRELGTLTVRLEQMESELIQMRQALSNQRSVQNESQAGREEMNEHIQELTHQNQLLIQELEQTRSRNQEIESQLGQMRQERDEALVASTEIARLTQQADQLNSSWNQQRQELDEQMNLLRAENGHLRDQLAESHAQAESQRQQQIAELQGKLQELQQQLADSEQQSDQRLAEVKAQAEQEITQIRQERDQLRSSQNELSGKLASMLNGFGVIEVREQEPTENGEARPMKMYIKAATRRDPLSEISGIGPAYEERLYNAGITRFSQLAELNRDRIRAIVQPEDWEEIDAERWIEDASLRAGGNLV